MGISAGPRARRTQHSAQPVWQAVPRGTYRPRGAADLPQRSSQLASCQVLATAGVETDHQRERRNDELGNASPARRLDDNGEICNSATAAIHLTARRLTPGECPFA